MHTQRLNTVSLIFTFTCLLLLFLNSGVQAQQVREYAAIDTLNVGDEFSFSITLNRNELYDDLIFPDSSHFGSDFEIRSRRRYKVTEYKDSLYYRLQFFGTGDSQIDPLPVRLVSGTDTTLLFTNAVPVYFSSVLQSEEEEFRPLKPIFDFARAWWPYLLALILLAAGGWYFYRWYWKKTEKPERKEGPDFQPEPFVDPLKELSTRLRELKSFTFEEEEDYKQFYINLGDAIRNYFERMYRIPALESTSREIIYELNRRSVDESLVEQTRIVLNEADMVKFARFTPTPDQAWGALEKGEQFLKRARDIDGRRVDHMRREHTDKMERLRMRHEMKQDHEQEQDPEPAEEEA